MPLKPKMLMRSEPRLRSAFEVMAVKSRSGALCGAQDLCPFAAECIKKSPFNRESTLPVAMTDYQKALKSPAGWGDINEAGCATGSCERCGSGRQKRCVCVMVGNHWNYAAFTSFFICIL